MKRKIIAIATAIMALTMAGDMVVHAQDEINVKIEGQPVVFAGQPPVVVDGRTFMPVRDVFEHLGFEVEWQGEVRIPTIRWGRRSTVDTQAITMIRGEDVVNLHIGVYESQVNDDWVSLVAPPQIIGGSTMMPIRHVLEHLGYHVGWDYATSTMHISAESLPATVVAQQLPIEGIWQGIWGSIWQGMGWITEGPVTYQFFADGTGYRGVFVGFWLTGDFSNLKWSVEGDVLSITTTIHPHEGELIVEYRIEFLEDNIMRLTLINETRILMGGELALSEPFELSQRTGRTIIVELQPKHVGRDVSDLPGTWQLASTNHASPFGDEFEFIRGYPSGITFVILDIFGEEMLGLLDEIDTTRGNPGFYKWNVYLYRKD